MKRLIRLLFVIEFFNTLAYGLLSPVLAVYVKKLGGNLFTAGLATAIATIVTGLLIAIVGRIAERQKSEKLFMVIGYLVASLAAVGFLVITTTWQLYIVEIISGISIALIQPSLQGLYSAALEDGKHTSGWGDFTGFLYVVAAFSALYSGFVSQTFGFTALFASMLVAQLASVVGSIYLYRLPDEIKVASS
jgi:MFS-type transporter involved in bile tolerance (Atg22 family)